MSDVPALSLADGRTVKLGRLPRTKKFGAGQLWLHDLLGPLLTVEPPATCDYTGKAAAALKRMYCNDRLGCCVMSGAFHDLGVKTGNSTDKAVEATDAEVQSQYFKLSGGRDSGLVIADMLEYWKASGIVAGGKTYKIDEYIPVDFTNPRAVKWAILVCGGVKAGIELPGAWQNSDTWDVSNAGRIVGGHDVEFFGYDESGVILSTWGSLRKMTWAAVVDRRIMDEAYGSLEPDWEAHAPNGLDLSAMKAAIDAIRNGQDPNIAPTPPPYADLWGGGL